MLVIAWYNLVAIFIGVFLLLWLIHILRNIEDTVGGALRAIFQSMLWLLATLVFIALWGGIFWW